MPRTRLLFFIALVFTARTAWPQGNPLGPEFRVNTYTTSFQADPSIALDSAGDFIVVWTSYAQDGSGRGVFGQRYASSGDPVGSEFSVNTYATGNQLDSSVAADSAGSFVVVWSSDGQDGSLLGVFGQRHDSSGAPLGPEFRVNTFTTGTQYLPAVASDLSGNFVVIWASNLQDGSLLGVFGQRYDTFGATLGPEFRVNTFTTNTQFYPSVASDPVGNFVVVWTSNGQDLSSTGIFAQRYASSGAPLGPEFRVNTYTAGEQTRPAVVSDASGNFVVVWESPQDGSFMGVFGQRYASNGAPLGPEFRVNTYTTGQQNRPVVASDASGNVVVVWESPDDPSFDGVFGQRYASTGVPLGPEFRVNTYTPYTQFYPSVAADTFGNFVVVWAGELQDGSSLGIFGQRYGRIVPVELMHFRVE